MKTRSGTWLLVGLLASNVAHADVPAFITYSGRLTEGTAWGQSTTLQLTFAVYAQAEGGTALWTSDPTEVAVSDGYFSVILGEGTDAGGARVAVTEIFAANPSTWLGVSVGTEVELAPRQAIGSVPYAARAASAMCLVEPDIYIRNQTEGMQSGSFRIDGNGYVGGTVGIGTTVPSSTLDVRATPSADYTVVTLGSDHRGDTPAGAIARVDWRSGNPIDVGVYRIASIGAGLHADQTGVGGDLRFYTKDGGAAEGLAETMRIDRSGRVGIGTKTPSKQLHVAAPTDGGQLALEWSGKHMASIGVTEGNLMVFRDGNQQQRLSLNMGSGTLNISGACTSAGADCANDVAESFLAGEPLEAGDVVSLDPARFKVIELSQTPYDPLVAGVVSTAPTLTMGSQAEGVPLALTGVVPVRVCGESGSIAVGDLLTTSSTPGHAMRATRPGPVLGKAMEPFDASEGGVGLVRVLLSPSAVGTETAELEAQVEAQAREIEELRKQNESLAQRVRAIEAAVEGRIGEGGERAF